MVSFTVSERGFRDRRERPDRVGIALAGQHRHGLPKIARVNEAWIADEQTAEIELETVDGQKVVLPLDGYAMENLRALLDQLLALKNTE